MQQTARNNFTTPLFLSLLAPILFFSVIFSILTPLPILYLLLLSPTAFSYLYVSFSILLGSVLSFLLLGIPGGLSFFLLSISTLPLAELLKRNIRVEWAVISSMLSFLVLGGSFIFLFSGWEEIFSWIQNLAQEQKSQNTLINEQGKKLLELLAKNPMNALPQITSIFFDILIFLYTLPLIFCLHWNPQNLRRRIGLSHRFLLEWRSPEYLIWPTLFAAAVLIFKIKPLESSMHVLLHLLLRVYLLHGLSILAFFLHKTPVKTLFRTPIYGIAVLLLGPMLSSFGFFDLWFNFRKKYKYLWKSKD